MQEIVQQRCFRHRQREAVARCLDCEQFYCRECVTEHQGRLLCSACLSRQAESVIGDTGKGAVISRIVQFACGSLMIWLAFYLVGYLLLSIPSAFHEGTIWKLGGGG